MDCNYYATLTDDMEETLDIIETELSTLEVTNWENLTEDERERYYTLQGAQGMVMRQLEEKT